MRSADEPATASARPPCISRQYIVNMLRYLKGTRTMSSVFASSYGLDLDVYSDSDCALHKDDSRSVTGSAVLCGKYSLSWIYL